MFAALVAAAAAGNIATYSAPLIGAPLAYTAAAAPLAYSTEYAGYPAYSSYSAYKPAVAYNAYNAYNYGALPYAASAYSTSYNSGIVKPLVYTAGYGYPYAH